jgi:hypothetical protein
MDAKNPLSLTQGDIGVLVNWLGRNDPERSHIAHMVLCCMGPEVAPILVREAIRRGRNVQHRLVILDVMQRIGGPLGMDEILLLQGMLGDRNPRIRRKAELVIMAVGPCGLPESPEDEAFMRAFNPFLQPFPRLRRSGKKKDSEFNELRREVLAAARRQLKREKPEQQESSLDENAAVAESYE